MKQIVRAHYIQYSAKLVLQWSLQCAKSVKTVPKKTFGTHQGYSLDVRVPSFTPTEDAKARWKTT